MFKETTVLLALPCGFAALCWTKITFSCQDSGSFLLGCFCKQEKSPKPKQENRFTPTNSTFAESDIHCILLVFACAFLSHMFSILQRVNVVQYPGGQLGPRMCRVLLCLCGIFQRSSLAESVSPNAAHNSQLSRI